MGTSGVSQKRHKMVRDVKRIGQQVEDGAGRDAAPFDGARCFWISNPKRFSRELFDAFCPGGSRGLL
jgi:hypothetical protein